MSLTISEKSAFTPAPAGLHSASCISIVDLGVQPSAYGNRPQVLLTWELDVPMEDGRPFIVHRRFTASLSKKSALREILESWRGRPFTREEASAFNLATLLVHNQAASWVMVSRGAGGQS